MHGLDTTTTVFIILTVIFIMLLGVAILIIIDHKAKLELHTQSKDVFSISGIRRDHPLFGFMITIILFIIILALLFELTVAFSSKLGLLQETEQPTLVKKLAEQRFTEKKRHFHNEPEVDRVNMGKKPVCFYCHGDYPHFTLPMVRSLLNMHTQFLGCLTCHNDPRKIDEKSLSFDWLNYSGIEVTGPKFGTDIDPKTGFIYDTDDVYSKIVAYTSHDGSKRLLEITEDMPEVKEFTSMGGKFTSRDREVFKKALHKYVSPKGRFCTRCHDGEKKSYLPFRKLGFSQQRVNELTNINIVGIVQKYKQFYMPQLFKYKEPLPDLEYLVGEEQKKTNKQPKKQPQDWWFK